MKNTFLMAIAICILRNSASAEDQMQVLERYYKANNLELTSIEMEIYQAQLELEISYFKKIYSLWGKADSDSDKESVGELLRSERCNLWTIDHSSTGILRKYIIGNEEESKILDEILLFNRKRTGVKIMAATHDLPMDKESALIRLTNDYHIDQPEDQLVADIRAAGYMSFIVPGFNNLKDIPKFVLDALPNATDRQKLTQVSTLDIIIAGVRKHYVIMNKRVVKITND